MSEKYEGPGFDFCHVSGEISSKYQNRVSQLIGLARLLIEKVPVPEGDIANAGNLSFRTRRGCVITRSGCRLADLVSADLVEVVKADLEKRRVHTRSLAPNPPSSETFLHLAIYRLRSDVRAIIHLHSLEIVAYANLLQAPITQQEYHYGSAQFIEEVLKVLGTHKLVCLGGLEHIGILSLGHSLSDAAHVVTDAIEKIRLSKSFGPATCLSALICGF